MNAAKMPPDELWVCHVGLVPYSDGLAIQETLRARRHAGEIPDTLLLLEHPPVYTRGRRSAEGELPFGEDFYRAKGIDVIDTDRGGRITYHGPGQLVGYPIMAVTDVVVHLRTMEDGIVAALAEAGVEAHARPQDGPDYTGVWVQDRKIASIGVHVSRGIATHGFAVNVHNDLDPFSWVVACGLPDVRMTSLAVETNGDCDSLACFRKRIAHSFCSAHSRRQRLVSPQRLGIDTSHAERHASKRAPIDPNPLAEAIPV
ncbi:MAG TPA: lipoyl(octanoyl) transferase LipB [Solirubrobacteraceae bacterium]|nr:lipoyl(octanoyl) transferase LipB [Solirubrobacteraceae bacterium]